MSFQWPDFACWERRLAPSHWMGSGFTALSVTTGAQKYRFDPNSGELLGQPFTPFAPHLRLSSSAAE